MNPRHGEVWLADMGLAAKTRPTIVLIADNLNAPRSLVIHIPITRENRGSELEVPLGHLPFPDKESVANDSISICASRANRTVTALHCCIATSQGKSSRLAALPAGASRAVKLGGTVATVGFPNIGLQGFAPKVLAHGAPRARSRRCRAFATPECFIHVPRRSAARVDNRQVGERASSTQAGRGG